MKESTIILILALISSSVFAESFSINTANSESPQNIDTNYAMGGGGAAFSITQSSDTSTITTFNSVSCPADNDSYFRRFDLDGDHGLAEAINVSSVDFGVESTAGITLDVNLYSVPNGALTELANLTLIGSASIAITGADDLTVVSTNVSGNIDGATDDLVVEVFSPDTTDTTSFFIGSNANGQTGASFLLSAGCGAAEPTDTAVLGFPGMHIVMVVNGAIAGPPPLVPTMTWYGLIAMLLLFAVFGRRFLRKS